MEYIKSGDIHKVYDDGELVGFIECDRTTTSIRGYRTRTKKQILGYGYGGYEKNLKKAKETFERQYKKFLKKVEECDYYAPEIETYFADKDSYERFRNTPVYKKIIK